MTKGLNCVILAALAGVALVLPAYAADFPFRQSVSIRIGQSVILKGVRAGNCSNTAPSWANVARGLPKSNLGTFSNGGQGTVQSRACKGQVAARGVRFTARKAGKEALVIFEDAIRINVN